MIFNHTGNMGDILYSLPFVLELCEAGNIPLNQCTFNIQIDVPTTYIQEHPNGNVLMTKSAALFLKPLLDIIGFKEVTISSEKPEKCIALEFFRDIKLNTMAGDIRSWYYTISMSHLPQDFSKKIINFEGVDERLKNKIIICRSSRYLNPMINWKILEEFKDNFIFMGLQSEYEAFCNDVFPIQYVKIKNAMEAAIVFNSCLGTISNQNGLYCIAELMKIPRLLITAEYIRINDKNVFGPVNNIPCGGWFECIRTNIKLKSMCNELLKLKH